MVVSRDSIKKAAPTSQSSKTLFRLLVEENTGGAPGWLSLLANMSRSISAVVFRAANAFSSFDLFRHSG
jgi:hypothetical protein